jgi:hypothetical protein
MTNKLFVLANRDGEVFRAIYEGHTEEQVRTLLAELGCTDVRFVTEKELS